MVGDGVIVAVVAPVFQLYVVAPLAVKVAELPAQIVALFTVTVGIGVTVMVAVFVEEHPPVVPVMV